MSDLLRTRGVPDGLIRQLGDMGRLGELIRLSLEQATDAELARIVQEWEKARR